MGEAVCCHCGTDASASDDFLDKVRETCFKFLLSSRDERIVQCLDSLSWSASILAADHTVLLGNELLTGGPDDEVGEAHRGDPALRQRRFAGQVRADCCLFPLRDPLVNRAHAEHRRDDPSPAHQLSEKIRGQPELPDHDGESRGRRAYDHRASWHITLSEAHA